MKKVNSVEIKPPGPDDSCHADGPPIEVVVDIDGRGEYTERLGFAQNTEEHPWPRLLTKDEIAAVHAVPGNTVCADTVSSLPGLPSWASTTFNVVLSPQAAGVHRGLGVHVSRVLSLKLDAWDQASFLALLERGNSKHNADFEVKLPVGVAKPELRAEIVSKGLDPDTALELSRYIRSKYALRAFTEGGSGLLCEVETPTSSRARADSDATGASAQYCGLLFILIKHARSVVRLDVASESDPYVSASLVGGKQCLKTTFKVDNKDPVWNELLSLNVRDPLTDVLLLQVWDKDLITDDLCGFYHLSLTELMQGLEADIAAKVPFDDLVLLGGERHRCGKMFACLPICRQNQKRGTLSVELWYEPLD